MKEKVNSWFVRVNPSVVDASVRLICFPHSGAGASVYRKWASELRNVEIYSAQLPGRENRISEKAIENIHVLVEELLAFMNFIEGKPFILFGHSLGALIAYELVCALERRQGPQPKHLIVSAFRAPDCVSLNKQLHNLNADDFVMELKKYGGMSDEILSNLELMELLIPSIRGDFKVHETYKFPQNPELKTSITSIAGDNDNVVTVSQMFGWRNHTSGEYGHHTVSGGHFFIVESRKQCLQIVQSLIDDSAGDFSQKSLYNIGIATKRSRGIDEIIQQ